MHSVYLLLIFFQLMCQSALCEKGRNKVHHQRPLILQPGFDHKRRGCRGCPCSVNQRVQNWVATHVKELGAKLAEQLLPQWTKPLFSSHSQWRQNCHKLQRGTIQLAVWPDLPRWSILKALQYCGVRLVKKKIVQVVINNTTNNQAMRQMLIDNKNKLY